MNLEDRMPMLRLELQASKVTLMRALAERHDDLQRMVADAMDRALPQIQAQIDAQMLEAVQQAVARALRDAADAAVERVADTLVESLGGKLEAALRKRVK